MAKLPKHCVYYENLHPGGGEIAETLRIFRKFASRGWRHCRNTAYIMKMLIQGVATLPKHCVYYENVDPGGGDIAETLRIL